MKYSKNVPIGDIDSEYEWSGSYLRRKPPRSGLGRNLDLIRKYGTDKDKDCLRGSGNWSGTQPLSKTFYNRLKKAGKKMG